MNHIPAGMMISPWRRDRIEPRPLSPAEQGALEYLKIARQQVRNAQAVTRSIQGLPDKHPALVDMGLFMDELEWAIETYLAPAMDAIEAEPGNEAQAEEDARDE